MDTDDSYLYGYEEEGVPEEEFRKNNLYDRVDNYEIKLPEDFERVKVESDGDDDGDGDDTRTRILQALTGLPRAAFQGRRKLSPGYGQLCKRFFRMRKDTQSPLPKTELERLERTAVKKRLSDKASLENLIKFHDHFTEMRNMQLGKKSQGSPIAPESV